MRPDHRTTRPMFLGALLAAFVSAGRAGADALPRVDDVEFQPLAAAGPPGRRGAGNARPAAPRPRPKAGLEKAITSIDVRAIQEALDPLCLIGVAINPESRVKADQGPAPAGLGSERLEELSGQGP